MVATEVVGMVVAVEVVEVVVAMAVLEPRRARWERSWCWWFLAVPATRLLAVAMITRGLVGATEVM